MNTSTSDCVVPMDGVTENKSKAEEEVKCRSQKAEDVWHKFVVQKHNKFVPNILPVLRLLIPDEKHQRPKSYNECDIRRTTCARRQRRTVSSSVFEPDCRHNDSRRKSVITNKIERLNTTLLDAIEYHNNVEVESILHAGASPNASCRTSHISACHTAAFCNGDALHLLLRFNAEKTRYDKFGRTPLHVAAWAGQNWNIAMLLDFPIDLQYKVTVRVTPEVEEEIKAIRDQWSSVIDMPCELPLMPAIPQTWKDSIEHKCRRFMSNLPKVFSGWTPLHIASFAGHHNATRLLLAAGANPNYKDPMRQTPMDIVGAACFLENTKVNVEEFEKTIKVLLEYGGKLNGQASATLNRYSALHTAVELHSIQGIHMLCTAGAPISQLSATGNTALHDCVRKFYKEPLEVLASYSKCGCGSLDECNQAGYTVLHEAIKVGWIPGVCVVLDSGADVTIEARDGMTAIHLAALKGDLDIVDEILRNASQYENAVNYSKGRAEQPIYCAIRSGIIECVQAFLDAGAVPKLTYYIEPTLSDTSMKAYLLLIESDTLKNLNMILHATAETDNINMLELLFEYDKSLYKLLFYECPYLEKMTPVEYAASRNKFFTFKYLLHKTIEYYQIYNMEFNYSNLLHIIVKNNREEMFKVLVREKPEVVSYALETGYYPLHVAAINSNRNLIVQLIFHGADLSHQDEQGNTAISLIIDNIAKPTEFLSNLFDAYILMTPTEDKHAFSEITVDYRALIPERCKWYYIFKGDDQCRVLSALLKTGNRKNQRKLLGHPLIESFMHLKWKTLSTYFYLMVFLYFLFVMSLTVFTVSTYYFKDNGYNSSATENLEMQWRWKPMLWKYATYVTLGIVFIQELSCTNLSPRKWTRKFYYTEFWAKFAAGAFAIALPQVVSVDYETKTGGIDWQRHLATVALAVAWLNIMVLLSKTPMAGYYMEMFWKISLKIIQILLTFLFLILMFSFCFMVQFHAQVPFEGPWAAVVKTLVMMTSEFDYSETFTLEKAKSLSTPIQLLRVVFVVFLILTAIVLMNLTIGVAVHDIQNLVQEGNLKRLDKQVGFLNRLEVSRGKTSFFHILGLHRWFNRQKVPKTVTIKSVATKCPFSSQIMEALVNKAEEQFNRLEKKAESYKLETKLENITRDLRNIEVNILHHIFDMKSNLEQLKHDCTNHGARKDKRL